MIALFKLSERYFKFTIEDWEIKKKSINHNGTQRITQRYTKEVSRKDAKTQMKIDKGNKRLTDLRPIINRQYAELFLLQGDGRADKNHNFNLKRRPGGSFSYLYLSFYNGKNILKRRDYE